MDIVHSMRGNWCRDLVPDAIHVAIIIKTHLKHALSQPGGESQAQESTSTGPHPATDS